VEENSPFTNKGSGEERQKGPAAYHTVQTMERVHINFKKRCTEMDVDKTYRLCSPARPLIEFVEKLLS
jgi:hypothetical protein